MNECQSCGLENASEVDEDDYGYEYLCDLCQKCNQPNPNPEPEPDEF